ncbi:ComEC/Rec2 family competence protein [Helicobacter sp. 11S02596-1]|uniref:ComEC/Rec2 family competence protein n=1 Tax=Helicobacter sp. 11S02596-1 TaxID=1476194 RepID=UPI000BC4A071|nr:ComEC/Rec2 family competence protein [Helicobacter sp. 11S02596-1]PAF44316.1 hypothetical protein BJI48_03830 [Helicobacter sp. 11S02596-1]
MKKLKTSPYDIFLIDGYKEWLVVGGILLLVFVANLGLKYSQFLQLDFAKPQDITAQVLLQYPKTKEKTLKNGNKKTETYFVLKLIDSNANVFYTISKEDIKDITNRYVRVYGQFKECSFLEFMKSCYVNAYRIALLHKRDYRDKIREFIDSQHSSTPNEAFSSSDEVSVGNLYRALFIADPLAKSWRELSNKLGLAHIIAISGFHLGILSGFFYFLFAPIYRYFQKRYFPYRNEAYDLGAVILCLMFGYLLLLDFQPSFFRSFVMAGVAFLVYYSGMRILSFASLLFVCLFCVAISPSLAFNIGFILSVAGVFYIFLFLKYFPKMHFILYAICLSLAIFFNISPIVHYFFPYFSLYQFVSIPVGFVFVIFFPLSLGLHFFGLGGLFDDFLLHALTLKPPFISYITPMWFVLFYVGLSLGAVYSKGAYWLLNVCSLGFFIFLLLKYL